MSSDTSPPTWHQLVYRILKLLSGYVPHHIVDGAAQLVDVLESLALEMTFDPGKEPVIAWSDVGGVSRMREDTGLGGSQVTGHNVCAVSRSAIMLQPPAACHPHLRASAAHCSPQMPENVKVQMSSNSQSTGGEFSVHNSPNVKEHHQHQSLCAESTAGFVGALLTTEQPLTCHLPWRGIISQYPGLISGDNGFQKVPSVGPESQKLSANINTTGSLLVGQFMRGPSGGAFLEVQTSPQCFVHHACSERCDQRSDSGGESVSQKCLQQVQWARARALQPQTLCITCYTKRLYLDMI